MQINEEIQILKNRIENNICQNCDDPEWIKLITRPNFKKEFRETCRNSVGHQMQMAVMPTVLAGKQLIIAAESEAINLVNTISNIFNKRR